MSTSGPTSLGLVSGYKATSDQGANQTAKLNDGAATPPGAECPVIIPPHSDTGAGDIFDESSTPLPESLLGLEQPQRQNVQWPSPNYLRLVIIVGLMILIVASMIFQEEHTSELITLLAVIVTFYFARDTLTKR